jgi:hypothetical protein
MKLVTKGILPFQEDDFFLAIRDKIDYAWLILHSARLLLLNIDTSTYTVNSSLKLFIDKMSRIFLYKEGKFFSVSFPFNISIEGDKVTEIYTYSGNLVDNQVISAAISILNNGKFRLKPSPVDFWIEADSIELPGLSLLEEIFLFEPSYIRYDNDPKNVNGKLHPLHHLDVNYSAYGTYKLGLNASILDTYFEDILNIKTDCIFIS